MSECGTFSLPIPRCFLETGDFRDLYNHARTASNIGANISGCEIDSANRIRKVLVCCNLGYAPLERCGMNLRALYGITPRYIPGSRVWRTTSTATEASAARTRTRFSATGRKPWIQA